METCKNMSEFVKVIRSVEAKTDQFIDIIFSTSEVTIFRTTSYRYSRSLIWPEAEKLINCPLSGLDVGDADIDLLVIDKLFNELDGSDYVFKVYIHKHVCTDSSGEWFSIDFVYTEK